MKRFSWLRYVGTLFGRSLTRQELRGRRRLSVAAARVEGLEERWLLSGNSLSDQILTDEIAPGAVIERTYRDYPGLDPQDPLSEIFGPVVPTQRLNGNGLEFNFNPAPGMPQFAIDGFQEAADLWSSILNDDIVVNVDINFTALPSGILGQAGSTSVNTTFSTWRTTLSADVTSADDASTVANLPQGSSFGMWINRTSNNPNGSGSATPYFDNDGDANNTTIAVNTANAKAAGLIAPDSAASDASISFSTQFSWDFDRSNGIDAGAFDFVGVAAHEIGHALGFVSGVDILDFNSPPFNGPFADNLFTFVVPLDLYRFTDQSLANGAGVIDWSADTRDKFFSVDGGATFLTTFSTGVNFGDGRQNSHWEDNLDIGIMDPTGAPGEFMDITDFDKQAFDVIGWDLDTGFEPVLLPTSGSTNVAEAGGTDTYTIGLPTMPSGIIQITVTADSQTEVSTDGISFFNSRVLTFSDQTPQTITVRAIDDAIAEGPHTGTITHQITASTDPNYTTAVNVDSMPVEITDNELAPFERVEPLGSLISVSDDNTGNLNATGEIRDYAFFAEAGSTFAAVADPASAAFLSVELLGVAPVAFSPTPGANAVLAPQLIPFTGLYTVRVSGSIATDFGLTAYRNTAIEEAIGDADNGNELAIDNSQLQPNSGRLAVIGTSAPPTGGPLLFNQTIDPSLFVDISATGNRQDLGDDSTVTVATTVGNQAFPAGFITISNNGAILAGANQTIDYSNTTLPAIGLGNVLLPYWDDIYFSTVGGDVYWQELQVNGIDTLIVQWDNLPHIENQTGSGTFQLQLFASGPVLARYVYPDVNFEQVSLNFGSSATIGYQRNAGDFLQFSFNSPIITNGTVLDLVPATMQFDVDEYTVNLTGKVGQSVDVVLAGLGGISFADQTLELVAPDGTTTLATGVIDPVQSGTDATNFDLAIQGFVVPADGVYTIRVSSSIFGEYSLLVTEGLGFEAEANEDVAMGPLRDISTTQHMLGYLDSTNAAALDADFTNGSSPSLEGFTIDNYLGGLWHQSTGRSASPGHTAPDSLYFGFGESETGGGTFNTGARVAGRVVSSPIDLTTASGATLSFQYLLACEGGTDFDLASVQISLNGGGFSTLVQKLPLASTFQTFSLDLDTFVGNSVQIAFDFDTVDSALNNFEGWYIDDIQIIGDDIHPRDTYTISVDAGELVNIDTTTPFASSATTPLNSLNPEVQVIHPDGTTIVASDLDSAPDGKNAQLSFIAPVAGIYQVRVLATSGTGEYVLNAAVDQTPPAVTNLSPADDAINVPVSADLAITFDKAVFKGTGDILLKDSTTNATVQTINVNSAAVTVATNVVTIALANMASATGYYVVVPNTAFADQNGNPFPGFSAPTAWNFTTADILPPAIINLSPADDATSVGLTTNLTLTFDEAVLKGTGDIVIKKSSDGSTVQTIDVTSAAVVVAGSVVTVDIADLASSTGYYVQIAAGAFKDSSNNSFVGIGSSTAWNFTTGDFDPPLISTLSPPDNAIDVAVNSDLLLTFNETVVKGTGDILIKQSSDNSTVQTINVTSAQVVVFGNVVTIDLALLTTTTGYYVEVPSTALRDTANNPFAGFTGSAAWNFTTSANQIPVITSAAAVSIVENTATAAVILDVEASDADLLPVQTLTYSLSGVDAGRFNIDPLTGQIRFAAVPDFEVPTDAGFNNVYNVTVTVTDNGTPNLSASQALTITVTALNDNAPVISSSSTASVPENTSTAAVVLDVNATDADWPAQGLTYSLSGADATRFTIDGATGEIKFVTSPNFEVPTDVGTNNVYNVTVTITDNGTPAQSTSQALTISVTNLNDNTPVIGSSATANVAENFLTSVVVLDVNATDADLPPQPLNYTLSGPDAAAFLINNFTGEIRFVSSPDFEIPTDQNGDHVYDVTVTVADNGSPALTASQALTITVTALNDNTPLITSSASGSIPENSAAGTVVLDVDAVDADQPGQSLTYSLTGPGAAFLNIDSVTGEITFAINLNYENPADPNSDNVYEVTVLVTDNGSPGLSATQQVSLSVTPVNDNTPSITSGATASVPENTPTSAVILDVNATDADRPGSSLSYSLAGPDAALLTIDPATGQIRFVASPNFESPVDQEGDHTYQVTVTVSDNDGVARTASQALTITVTPVNDNAPVISAGSTATIAENSAAATVLIDVDATDTDLPGQTLTYAISGPDAARFSINSATGVLTFLSSPNFEAPTDQGANNVYNLTVTVTDSGSPSQQVTQDLTVNVTNVNEAPTDFNLSVTSIGENLPANTVVGGFVTTDVDAGDTFAYSLVAGPGSADNALFVIVGAELRTAATFDFETRSAYSIRVRTTDASGLLFEKAVTITVVDANDNPTDLALSGNVVTENQPVGTLIGSLTTTDQDPTDTFTYSLASGAGSTDNASFAIVGDQIQTAATFNFEAKSNYSLRVRSIDAGGKFTEKVFVVTVQDVNEQPTDLGLSKLTIAENLAPATAIGSFFTLDQDNNENFTYELVSGAGSDDNASFTIFGAQLLANERFDFESRSSYSIRVRSTDKGGLSTEKTLTIGVINVNEQPTAIAMSSTTLPEAQAAGFVVGTFNTTDIDLNDTFDYTLVLGTGSNDNNKFEIVGNELRTLVSFDFETGSTYSIRLRSRDSGGLFLFSTFMISVTNSNEAPLDVTLAPAIVGENQPADTVVGTFNTTDGDLGDIFTYTLVPGAGSTNNAAFTIVGGQLRALAPLNFEAQSGYAVRVRSTDSGGMSVEKALTVNVSNANEAPTEVGLSSSSVVENQLVGTLVGNLSSTDPDLNETFTFALVPGTGSTDNASFTISGNQLRTANVFDFETKSSYSVRIRSTDASGLSFEKSFTINVTGVNETPQEMTLAPTSVTENQPAGTVVGALTTTDQDAGNTFTYAFVPGVGGIDNASFVIDGNQIKTTSSLNFEATPTFSVRVRGTDSGGLSIERSYSITVTNANEAPASLSLTNSTIPENQPASTEIGTFDSTDPDAGEVFTYSLVSGAGSTGNTAFTIMGDRLLAISPLDFEAQDTYSIRVRSTDAGGLSFEQILTINVTNRVDPPVIELTPGNVTLPNGKGGLIDVGAAVSDQDSTNFQGNRLVVAVQSAGQLPSDRFRLVPSGKGATRLKATKTQLKLGKTVIGNVSGGRSGVPLTIAFTSNVDQALVQQVLRQLSFKTHGTPGNNRHIEFQMFDASGNTAGPVVKEVSMD